MKLDDTIVAIATASGAAGIGIVRMSGKNAKLLVMPFFKAKAKKFDWQKLVSHRLYMGWVYDDGHLLDEVLLTWMASPKSYTTEDVIEIHSHGSRLVLHSILSLLIRAGARLAEPGEFTQRAFYYGRLDLTQVEAVHDLIHARTQLGMHIAVNQLKGKLYQAIDQIKADILHVAALVSASIDFPEEDVVFTHKQDCLNKLNQAKLGLENLVQNAHKGKIVREGLAIALIGKPNVGKSSLLNAMLKEQRAIVTDIPGTTRDVIEESLQIHGLAIRLVDTAGIRETDNPVEIEGIQRSREIFKDADLVLLLLDSAAVLTKEDQHLLSLVDAKRVIVILNKIDLVVDQNIPWKTEVECFKTIMLSTKTKQGLEQLEQAIVEMGTGGEVALEEQILITNTRQQLAAQESLSLLEDAIKGLMQDQGEECLAVDLSSCLRKLGLIVGETTPDDLLNKIFSEFCIGK